MSGLVSVVIPVWNGARLIDQTLASVFAQDYRPIEVIVVDDGSTDDTVDVVGRWPQVKLVRQEHRGVGFTRNTGIAHATGAYVALQDADDLWEKDKLSVQIDYLEAHPEVGYVAAHPKNFLEPGHERPDWLSPAHRDEARPGGIGNLVVRAEVFRAIGAFAPDDPSDLAWSLRAQEAGVKSAVLERVLLHRRIHPGNISNQLDGTRVKLGALRSAIAHRRAARGDKA